MTYGLLERRLLKTEKLGGAKISRAYFCEEKAKRNCY